MRPFVSLNRFDGAKTFSRGERIPQQLLKLQLKVIPFQVFRKFDEPLQSHLKVSTCFDESGSRTRLSTGLKPIVDREFSLASLAIVLRHDLGSRVRNFGEVPAQDFGNFSVQLPALIKKYTGVGLVSNEGVLEGEALLTYVAASKHQTGG